MPKTKLQLNDPVRVKPHIEDPDLGTNIGGWQGRILEINENDGMICIRWDSITLKQMPGQIIDNCEEEGLDWTEMYLGPEDVELTTARDSEEDVEEIIDLLESKHAWSCLGEEGKRIQAVVNQAEDSSEWAVLEAWEEYFQKVLAYPFEAEVSEWQTRGPLRTGDRVTVLGADGLDDLYGILVSLRIERKNYVFPLCDLEIVDKSSPNYQPVKDYAIWFANR